MPPKNLSQELSLKTPDKDFLSAAWTSDCVMTSNNWDNCQQLCSQQRDRCQIEFKVQSEESFVIGKQRLAMEQGCSTVVYILGESIVEV